MIQKFDPSVLKPETAQDLPEQDFTYGSLKVHLSVEDFTRTLIVTGGEKMSDDAIEAMAVHLGFDENREFQYLKMVSSSFYRCVSQRR